MVDKLYKTFVDATHKVLSLMLNISDISDHPADNFNCENEVDVVIGIIGDLQGEVVYRFPASTSINIVNLMSGMQFEEVDAFVTSAVSEIANIISGNVISALSDNSLKCDILPPVQRKIDEEREYEFKTSCCLNAAIGGLCLEVRINRAS